MSALTVFLPTPLFESTTGLYTFQLVDEDGEGTDGAQLNSLTLTYYDMVTETILNGRDAQNVFNTNGILLTTVPGPPLVTTVAWELSQDDTVLYDPRREIEEHIALFQWSWAAGTRFAAHKVQLGIEALIHTLTLP